LKWKRKDKPTDIQRRGWQGHFLFLLGMLLSRLFLRLRYLGRDHIPRRGSYLVVANHQSMVDGLWIMGGIPSSQLPRFSVIGGSDLEQSFGLTGRILFRVGKVIPIDRHGNPLRGLLLAKKAIEKNTIVMIHPEGTRTYDGRIGEMKNGAAYLAKKTGVPVIPVYINGAFDVFSRHMSMPRPIDWKRFRRKKVTIEFCPPIDPAVFKDVDSLMEAISQTLLQKEEAALALGETTR
jgi:1-acyl-sn-glycerol-3-phosphate acyltransferase